MYQVIPNVGEIEKSLGEFFITNKNRLFEGSAIRHFQNITSQNSSRHLSSYCLPFPFLFYGVYFNKITISPLGYIKLLLKNNSNATIKNASIMVYLNAFDILQNALQCIISYGSSSVGMDDLVIKWDDSYEVIFHKNNRIDIKYLKNHPEK